MPTPAVNSTFVLERSFPQTPDRVFRLLADPDRKRRWFLEDEGTNIDSFAMDFRVGGTESSRYSIRKGTPVDGKPFANDGSFLDIVPNQRIVHAFTMSLDGRPISATMVTYELSPSGSGTALTLTHQGVFFEGSDGPEMRKGGWEKLMERLDAAVAGTTS